MLKKCTYVLIAATLIVAFISFRGKFYGSQPPSNHSGAPDGFGLCSDCHNNLNTGGGSVVVTGLPASFQPGVTYPFSITIAHPTARERWGFQINARNAAGENVGSFASAHPNATTGSSAAELLHNNAVFFSGTSYTYNNLSWTAPATPGSSDNNVTFYLAGNAANGNGSNTGDFIYTNTAMLTLPVTLKEFFSTTEGSLVHLFWTSLSESNSKEYVIERSDNNSRFQPIGSRPAAGFSAAEKKYSFTDEQLTVFNRPVYYRLKMIDQDHTSRYSKTLQLLVKQKTLLVQSLAPNPAGEQIALNLFTPTPAQAEILLTDANGRMVYRQTLPLEAGKKVHIIPLTTLQKGAYFVRVQAGAAQETHTFFKK